MKSRQVLRKEYLSTKETLTKENEDLLREVNRALQEKRNIESKLEELNKRLDGILNENQELQSKYDLLIKERDELSEKLKAQPVKETQEELSPKTESAYWAGVLKTKTELLLQLENMRSELNILRTSNEQLQRDLKSLAREKEEVEQKFNYNQKIFDNMASELVIESNAKRQLQEILKSLKEDNVILRQQLKSLSNRKVNLERKLAHLQEEKSLLERGFNERGLPLEDRLSKGLIRHKQRDTISSATDIEMSQSKGESIELPPILVRPQTEISTLQKESAEAEWGIILEVNKENNFVIIDLGEDSGIESGDTFDVYRGEKLIATIGVIRIRKRVSACDIKKEMTPIDIGDTVKRQMTR